MIGLGSDKKKEENIWENKKRGAGADSKLQIQINRKKEGNALEIKR